jgi:hypothetical protein
MDPVNGLGAIDPHSSPSIRLICNKQEIVHAGAATRCRGAEAETRNVSASDGSDSLVLGKKVWLRRIARAPTS